jgi:7-cyano-7-deazaguanine synthase in queuosine biosynthesis
VSDTAAAVWTAPGGVELRLSAPRRYHLDQARIAITFRAMLPARVADLLDIAMQLHAADRLTTRSLRDPLGRGWCRELMPEVEVRDLDFWSSPQVTEALVGLLDWLTEDYWAPRFLPFHGERAPAETQGTLFSLRPDSIAAVCCFSGGLDSFAGAAIDLGEQAGLELVAVGQSGTSRARALQRQLTDKLAARTGRVQPLLVKANLIGTKGQRQDRHQRTRGLVFLSLAAATALVAEVGEVRVYENGIGAINLPYSHSQMGAHMSRSAHPKTLLAMQRLVSMMDVGEVSFTAPRVFDTKAEMVVRVPEEFVDLIAITVSCDTWSSDRQPAPLHGERVHRCGRCASCVLRRQALRASDHGKLDAAWQYRSDVFDAASTPDDRFVLRLMLGQVAELDAAIGANDPWAGLTETYPQLVEARDALRGLGYRDDVESRLVRLYERYVDEWRRVDSSAFDRVIGKVAG